MSQINDLEKLLNALKGIQGIRSKASIKENIVVDLPDSEFIKHNLMENLSTQTYFILIHNASTFAECILKCAGMLMTDELELRQDPIEVFENECKDIVTFLKGMQEDIEKVKRQNLKEKTALLEKLNEAD